MAHFQLLQGRAAPPNLSDSSAATRRGIAFNEAAVFAGQPARRQEPKILDSVPPLDRTFISLRDQMSLVSVESHSLGSMASISDGLKVQVVELLTNRPTKSPQSPEPGRSPDFYANVGKAVETLKEETPFLFEKDLSYDIYRKDIIFKDPKNSFQGLLFYKYMFLSLRCHGTVFFRRIYLEIRNIWLPKDDFIRIRWTIHGFPRIPWDAEGIFDGVSNYKLDSDGKIYEHAVDNIIFRDPPVFKLPVLFSNLATSPSAVQQPCPGAWFKTSNNS